MTCYRTEYYIEFVCCAGYQQVGYSCERKCLLTVVLVLARCMDNV